MDREKTISPGGRLIRRRPAATYSIEDLAQLIHDLKNANPQARVHVKLVAEVGVGASRPGRRRRRGADLRPRRHRSGPAGQDQPGRALGAGPGRNPQTLLRARLRDRIRQADGQLNKVVIIAALLGAEEFGFAARRWSCRAACRSPVCHLDTCPVGVATQNPELHYKRFNGQPEFVVNFFEFIAKEVREYLAALGLRGLEEAVGRTDLLDGSGALEGRRAGPRADPAHARPGRGRSHPQRRHQDHGIERPWTTR